MPKSFLVKKSTAQTVPQSRFTEVKPAKAELKLFPCETEQAEEDKYKGWKQLDMSEYETGVDSLHTVVQEFQHQMSNYTGYSMFFPPDTEEDLQSPLGESSPSISNSSKGKEKPFKCSYCVMSFTRPSDLQRHLLIHNNNKPYKCEECDREFTWFGNFQKHVLSHMGGSTIGAGNLPFSAMFNFLAREQVKDLFIKEDEKFKCRLCAKDFTRLSGLKTHIRMHTGERPYVCEVCSFAFTTSRALKMHVRLHTGEKPYKCEECGRAFTRRDEMHTHMYIHKGEKPFKCDICSASFIRYGHLQRHLLIHSDDKPYKCKLCPKSFTQYRNLQTHMYKHTGERPYRCRYCPKGFTQYGTLQAHERTHTGEKPFQCKYCDKAFITSSHLRWHIKTQHHEKKNKA